MESHYDVIIVGGRPAGATLAARLGKQGLRVLLLERATFPSLPAASSPIIYPPVMRLLDEIGADEAVYARNTPRIRRFIADTRAFTTAVRLPDSQGRDYAYAIDRARFDAALWDNALRFPNVSGRQNFHVTDLLVEGEQVTGVVGREGKQGAPERFTADLVVGADGRFSLVARKTNAAVRDEFSGHPTSIYYAYWKNVQPYDDGGAVAVAYEGSPGWGYGAMDSADGLTMIGFEGQAALLDPAPGQVETFYRDLLDRHPKIRARLAGAEQVTPVHGMRRIGNLYRQPGGAGWALVGDAYHQHDPMDGQGIFNALFTAKSLAWAIRYWKRGEKSWDAALDWYDETARAKTYGMYRSTLDNVRMNLYGGALPEWAHTGMRWIMEDPGTHDLMGKMLTRQLPPEALLLLMPPTALRALARGPLRDLKKRLGLPVQ